VVATAQFLYLIAVIPSIQHWLFVYIVVMILWGLIELVRFFSERLFQADLSTLALGVVIAKWVILLHLKLRRNRL